MTVPPLIWANVVKPVATTAKAFAQVLLRDLLPLDHETAECMMNAMSDNAGAVGGGAIYGLGIFGAFVYYWQQADVFWEYLLSFVQGLFWPAWMVYEIFAALGG
jgi:hypothetical protein